MSILRFPTSWVNCTESRLRYAQNVAQGLTPDPFTYHCKVEWEAHGTVRLPVRTLGSVMKELGHTRIDVLKIDIEGSEVRKRIPFCSRSSSLRIYRAASMRLCDRFTSVNPTLIM